MNAQDYRALLDELERRDYRALLDELERRDRELRQILGDHYHTASAEALAYHRAWQHGLVGEARS